MIYSIFALIFAILFSLATVIWNYNQIKNDNLGGAMLVAANCIAALAWPVALIILSIFLFSRFLYFCIKKFSPLIERIRAKFDIID
jgi:chromate transport protein ChrA